MEMMRTWAVRLAIGCLGVLGPAAAAVAQPAGDEWRVTVAPYLMAAGMSGTAGIGRLETDVEVSASDIFSNLQFGAQGYFEVMKGDWGFGADVIWMALGTSTDTPVSANVDVNQGGFTFLALFKQIADAMPGTDALLAAAPAAGPLAGKLGGLASLAGGFKSLGLTPDIGAKMVPLLTKFMEGKGGTGAAKLLAGVLK